MDSKSVREQSLRLASGMGIPINQSLPLLDMPKQLQPIEAVIERVLCLHVVAAVAYGFHREKAKAWVHREEIYLCLTTAEREFLGSGIGDAGQFKMQIEGMWALSWAMLLVPELDFLKVCDSQFVTILPDLRISESSERIRRTAKLRDIDEIFLKCDLAYCLHWAIREAEISPSMQVPRIAAYVVVERRRALEWLLTTVNWDDLPLDT